MTGFVQAVGTVLSSQITKYLVLGDRGHGEKSLRCLAAAVKDGALQPLYKYHVGTVLFEGPERGQERSYEGGKYAKLVALLATNGVRVLGCEDAKSLSTFSDLVTVINDPYLDSKRKLQMHDALLNRRIPDANDSWIAQALKVKPKVIICCGTSHLPAFKDAQHGHIGIINKLHQKGMCYGFAVEKSNTDSAFWYIPEKGTGNYGRVETLDEYAGWDQI